MRGSTFYLGTWWLSAPLLGLVCTQAVTCASMWAVLGAESVFTADTQRHVSVSAGMPVLIETRGIDWVPTPACRSRWLEQRPAVAVKAAGRTTAGRARGGAGCAPRGRPRAAGASHRRPVSAWPGCWPGSSQRGYACCLDCTAYSQWITTDLRRRRAEAFLDWSMV